MPLGTTLALGTSSLPPSLPKGDLVWKGFGSSPAEPINASWPQIQGPVDAALRIHHLDNKEMHDNVYLFQVGGPLSPPSAQPPGGREGFSHPLPWDRSESPPQPASRERG